MSQVSLDQRENWSELFQYVSPPPILEPRSREVLRKEKELLDTPFRLRIASLFGCGHIFSPDIGEKAELLKQQGYTEKRAVRLALMVDGASLRDIEDNCKGKSKEEIEKWISEHFDI
jgi:hypothetical protein